jgi:hypothetical protein
MEGSRLAKLQIAASIAVQRCGLIAFSLRKPQQNRNELDETTVSKTWREQSGRREKSIT